MKKTILLSFIGTWFTLLGGPVSSVPKGLANERHEIGLTREQFKSATAGIYEFESGAQPEDLTE